MNDRMSRILRLWQKTSRWSHCLLQRRQMICLWQGIECWHGKVALSIKFLNIHHNLSVIRVPIM